jgi:3-methyl-2-oxobutanoate hydroxymethyltransferase
VHAMGGFKVQGKSEEAAARVIEGARALDDAGVYAIVLEAIPPDIAEAITALVSVPTIGIGAGPSCDGQVLVCYDLLGMYPDLKPKFAKRFAEIGEQIIKATTDYVGEVKSRVFPAAAHTFKPSGLRLFTREESQPSDGEIPPHWQTH